MSTPSDDLEVVQDLIRFCPLCGYESTKEFNDYISAGGDWACENCDEVVEAYILSTDEDETEEGEGEGEDDAESNGSLLFFCLVLMIIFGVYFFI